MDIFSCLACFGQKEECLDPEEYMITIHLPPEILELIFLELDLKGLQNCSQTCLRWKIVIGAMCKNKAKVLVATGYPLAMGQIIEVIDLINQNSKSLKHDLAGRYGAVGGLVQNVPVICGGENAYSNKFQDGFIIMFSVTNKSLKKYRFT